MFDAKLNHGGFLFLSETQLMFFRIKAVRVGLQFKVLQRGLLKLIIRVMDKIRILWKQCRSNIAENLTKTIVKIKDYLIRNWGAPFLVSFFVLLAGSAVSLSDALSVDAFYALTVGIVLQLASFLKYGQNTHTSEVPS
jgi:hypothetical protein